MGETAVMSFLGVHSHAIRKAPVLLDGTAVAPDVVEITPRAATPAELSVAEQVLSLVPGGPLLYARVDLVPGPDGPLLMELEVTEPSLFLSHSSGAAERLAAAVVESLPA